MASPKGKILRALTKVLLDRGEVVEAARIGRFRHLRLRVAGGAAEPPKPGSKIQVLLASDDVRTYTPIRAPGGFALLGWMHAGAEASAPAPGSRWLGEAAVGDPVLFFGPRPSTDVPGGPVVVVGDETSVALAAAYEAARPGQVYAVFQSNFAEDVRAAATAVGLRSFAVVAAGDTIAVAAAVAAGPFPGAPVAVTGASTLVAATRAALRAAGTRQVAAKAYWIPGRVGLD